MDSFKKILNETSNCLDDVLSENNDSKVMNSVNDLLREFTKKVTSLAHKHKVVLDTNLEDIRARLSNLALAMKNGKFKKQGKIDLKKDLKKLMSDDKESFKQAYLREIISFVESLKLLGEQASWLEVDYIAKPFFYIGCTEKDSIKEEREDINLLVAINEDAIVSEMYKIITEAEDDKTKPSLQPPKEWIEKLKKSMKKTSPHYSMERILRTIGDIWYHNLDDTKRSEIRGRYGKVYGKATT